MKEISCISMLATLLLLFTHCKGSKTSIPRETAMEKEASVLQLDCDFSGRIQIEDAAECRLLIVLPNGLIIQPSDQYEGDETLEDGDKVRVSYRVLEDMSPTCTKAIAKADITCLVKMKERQVKDCVNVRNPFDVEWMKNAVNDLDARKVTRYDLLEKKAYLFEGLGESVVYDCYGQELCRFDEAGRDDCMEVVSKLANEFVILVVNE